MMRGLEEPEAMSTVATSLRHIVLISPRVMSGTPVFKGTRVPVRALLDHLEAGDSLDVFLEDFPSVPRQQAIDFLELAGQAALAQLDARAA